RRYRPVVAAPRSRRVVVAAVARLAPSEVSRGQDRTAGLGLPVRRLHDSADRRARRHSQASGGVMLNLDARIPAGPVQEKWDRAKFEMKLVNPANKRKYKVIVIGSGLAGGAAAST